MKNETFLTILALLGIAICAAMSFNDMFGIITFYFFCMLAAGLDLYDYSVSRNISKFLLYSKIFTFTIVIIILSICIYAEYLN